MLALAISSLVMLIITYQDIKDRSIHWLTIPVLFIGLLWWQNFDWFYLIETGKNILFIISVLLILTLYMSIKHGSFQNITTSYFGWGDILFLFAITPSFTNQGFMIFFILGTLLVLIVSLILLRFSPSFTLIPYAGLFALLLNGFLLFSTFVNEKALLFLESNFFLID